VDAGGWVCSQAFDHTSALQFLETLGVREPDISAWRRRTFGDLMSVFRFTEKNAAPPVLPDAGMLSLAKTGVTSLPRLTLPGRRQNPQHRRKAPGNIS
jgi:phospholipase C